MLTISETEVHVWRASRAPSPPEEAELWRTLSAAETKGGEAVEVIFIENANGGAVTTSDVLSKRWRVARS